MNVIFCVDKAGLKQFAVAATSFAIHRPRDIRKLFLLSVDVKHADVDEFFQGLHRKYGLQCQLIQVPREKFDPFPVFGHVTVGTYFRLMIGEVLPDDVSKVLYLDTDVVVHRDLDKYLAKAVTDINSSGHIVAAVPEHSETTRHLHEAGILEGSYLQAGVMLINLPRWREAFSLEYFVNILNTYKKNIVWWDQDILNIALKDRWLELPKMLNGTAGSRTAETVIYHFAGNQKPWRYKAVVDDEDVWEHYRKQTQILRPRKTDPKTVIAYYSTPYQNAVRGLRKRLRRIFRTRQ